MAKKKVFQISDALTEGLEETITAAHNYSGELRIDVIPLRKIEVDPENPRDLMLDMEDLYKGLDENDEHYERKSQELESLETIAHSIREQGIINPIVVYKFGEKYRLVAGERRTLASILADKTEIQAKILESKPSDLKISLLQWIENVERSDLTLWERLRNLEKIVNTHAARKGIPPERITITELSNLIGCSKPHAMNYKAVLMADDHIAQLISENRIRNLEKAALLANIQVPELKQQAINACLAGNSLKQLRMIAEQENKKIKAKVTRQIAEKRGRQASVIHLGSTKNPKVAQIILETLHKNIAFFLPVELMKELDWNDYTSVSKIFNELITELELMHA